MEFTWAILQLYYWKTGKRFLSCIPKATEKEKSFTSGVKTVVKHGPIDSRFHIIGHPARKYRRFIVLLMGMAQNASYCGPVYILRDWQFRKMTDTPGQGSIQRVNGVESWLWAVWWISRHRAIIWPCSMTTADFLLKTENGPAFSHCIKPILPMAGSAGLIQFPYTRIMRSIFVSRGSFGPQMGINWLPCCGKTAEPRIHM